MHCFTARKSEAISPLCVKVIIRGITALKLRFPTLRCAFRRRRREPANRVYPLDGRHIAQLAVSGMPGDRHQKPWDRLGIRRVGFGRHLAGDLAAVVELPCGTAKMPADNLTVLVE